jgi:hypothetical protein
MRRWSIAILFCLLAACRHPAYTLARQGRSQLLTPPPSKPDIKNARGRPMEKTGCDIESGTFSLTWRGKTAHVAVKTEMYYAPPPDSAPPQNATPGITIAESGPRIYSDSLAQLEAFREALSAKEDAGCLRDADGARLRQTITETFPFPPQIIAYLRFGTYTYTGVIDLIPGFLLRVVSPAAAEPDVSFYTIADASDERVRIKLDSGAGKALAIPEAPAFYRYLYWTGASAHNFRSTILGAPDRKALHDATRQFLTDPEVYCAKPATGVFCESVAASVGLNVGFNIRVNGADVFVRIGGTISEALGEARNGLRVTGRGQPLPQNVTVRRMFHGKLIPIRVDGAPNDILGLVAVPGDEVTY